MGKVQWFKDYLIGLQAVIPGINRNRMVIDKSQLTDFLNAHSSLDNLLLIGVLPDFRGKGSTAEDFKLENTMQLMVLKKTTYSEHNYDEFYQIFEDTWITVEDVLKQILADSLSCSELRFLNVQSIQIQPVWNESACNGWKIMFNFDMSL
tara:strand:- start:320 stop:769 length:450 start_codon:yes stop_codon:yes gene_type:complete